LASGSTTVKEASRAPPKKQATVEDRKRQMAQLAAMGISIPDEYRGEMAMAGEWQVLSQKAVTKSSTKDAEERKLDISSSNAKKRKVEESVEEFEDEDHDIEDRGWRSRLKTYKDSHQHEQDLDELLSSSIVLKKQEDSDGSHSKESFLASQSVKNEERHTSNQDDDQMPTIKTERVDDEHPKTDKPLLTQNEATEGPTTSVVFKKRRPKVMKES